MAFGSLEDWANVAQIVGSVGIVIAVFALVLAWLQLSSSKAAIERSAKWTRGAMLFAIDTALNQYDDVRALARRPSWEPPLRKTGESEEARKERWRVHGYMGVFERIELLIEDDTIDVDLVKQFYGRRAELLMKKKNVQTYAKDEDWERFRSLQTRLDIPTD